MSTLVGQVDIREPSQLQLNQHTHTHIHALIRCVVTFNAFSCHEVFVWLVQSRSLCFSAFNTWAGIEMITKKQVCHFTFLNTPHQSRPNCALVNKPKLNPSNNCDFQCFCILLYIGERIIFEEIGFFGRYLEHLKLFFSPSQSEICWRVGLQEGKLMLGSFHPGFNVSWCLQSLDGLLWF